MIQWPNAWKCVLLYCFSGSVLFGFALAIGYYLSFYRATTLVRAFNKDVGHANTHTGGIVVSWSPRIVAFDHFLTDEESDYLFRMANGTQRWGRTALVGINGNGVPGHTITSKISGVPPQDPVVQKITHRMAEAALVPVEHMEYLHFLNYDPSNFFRGHLDAHGLEGRPTSSRMATFFIYLNDVPSRHGGETFFPMAVPIPAALKKSTFVQAGSASRACDRMGRKDPRVQNEQERSLYVDGFDLVNETTLSPSMEKRGLHVHPKKGAALIWWSRRPDGQIDPASQHTGCPLKEGKKFTIVNWMHFQPASLTPPCRPPEANVTGAPVCMMHDYHKCPGQFSKTCSVYTDPFGQGRPRR